MLPYCQRPVQVKRPPDWHDEWTVSSLQQISNHLQMLENTQTMDKETEAKTFEKRSSFKRTLGHFLLKYLSFISC